MYCLRERRRILEGDCLPLQTSPSSREIARRPRFRERFRGGGGGGIARTGVRPDAQRYARRFRGPDAFARSLAARPPLGEAPLGRVAVPTGPPTPHCLAPNFASLRPSRYAQRIPPSLASSLRPINARRVVPEPTARISRQVRKLTLPLELALRPSRLWQFGLARLRHY